MPQSSVAAAVHGPGSDRRPRDEQQGRLSYRAATARDVEEFYGRRTAETLRVVVVLLGERPVGIIGLARDGYSTRFFSEYKPELEPHLSSVTVWRAIKAALKFVDECRSPVYVVSSDARMMRRIGFQEVIEGLWRN
jgi:hypothetical protein